MRLTGGKGYREYGAIGHMGNRVQGVWGTGVWHTWAMRHMGNVDRDNGVQGIWVQGYGVQGIWSTWAMGI